MTYLVMGLVFATGFLLVFAANLLFADIGEANRQRMRERLLEETRLRQLERARVAMQHRDLYELAADEGNQVHPRKTLRERIGLTLEQAGVKTTPRQLVLMAIGLALGFGVLMGWLTRSILFGALLAPFPACLPWLWIDMVRRSRLYRLQSQLPDAFDLMCRTMKAGQTVSQALQAVADEGGSPLAEEFGYCYDQQNLGMSPEAAMRDLARRNDLLEMKIFVLAVMVHRQTGGNLSELLEKLAGVIRDRYRVQGLIRALTAEGKLQAGILLALPLFLMATLFVVNRDYIMELFRFPLLLVSMFAFMALGTYWMKRIINFDF